MSYNFDAKDAKNKCVEWIRDWFENNGKNCNAIVGISGGKDSSVVAGLLVEALGKDRVIGVMMPNCIQSDIADSKNVCEFLGIKNYTINIGNCVKDLHDELLMGNDIYITTQTKTNLPARIRMSTLYAVSQSMNGRVVNTCNYSEDYVGYATRYGDAAGDFSPLANFTVTEVIAIGDELGLPYELTHKTPTDGLCGKTDEDNLGFTYDTLDKYIREGILPSDDVKQLIDTMHEKNLFKLQLMPSFKYTQD